MTGVPDLEGVKAIVTGIAGPQRTPADSGPDTPLGEGGFCLDSVDLLELLVACESQFGIAFEPGADFTAEALSTVKSLAEMILNRVSVIQPADTRPPP